MARKAQLEATVSVVGAEQSAAKIALVDGALKTSAKASGELTAAQSAAEKGMKRVGEVAVGEQTAMGGLSSTAKDLVKNMPLPFKVGAAAAATGLVVIGASVEAYTHLADKVRSFERVSGAGAETSSKFVYALDALGISADTGGTAIFMLGKKIGQGKDVLDKYGVSIARSKDGTRDLAGTVLNIADAYQKTKDPATRAALVQDAFGRGGKVLIPILEKGREGLKRFWDEAGRTHSILSQDDVDKAHELDLAMHQLSETATGFEREIGSAVAPAVTKITTALTDLLQVADKTGVIHAFATALETWISPLTLTAGLLKSATDELGLTSNETDKYSIVQKDLNEKQKEYSALLAEGKGHTAEARQLRRDLGAENQYVSGTQDQLSTAMKTTEQKAKDADTALRGLRDTLLGYDTTQRGAQRAVIDYQASQDHLKDSIDALNTAQAQGIQQGETQEQYNRRISGLQRDVQTSLLDTADAHDRVAKAAVDALLSTQSLAAAEADPAARTAMIGQLRAAQTQYGDTTGAIQAQIDKLLAYDATHPATKVLEVDTGDGEHKVTVLQSDIDRLHGTTVTIQMAVAGAEGVAKAIRNQYHAAHGEPLEHAAGGIIGAGGNLTWVGEQGRELVELPTGAKVHSNLQSEQMIRAAPPSSGSGATYVYSPTVEVRAAGVVVDKVALGRQILEGLDAVRDAGGGDLSRHFSNQR